MVSGGFAGGVRNRCNIRAVLCACGKCTKDVKATSELAMGLSILIMIM